MKRSALIPTFILIFSSVILAQVDIENPEKPLSKNAIRKVQLKEVMRVQDDPQNEIFFSYPLKARVDDKGNIYIYSRIPIYKFGPDGKFLLKMIKEGQGPGELTPGALGGGDASFYVVKDRIIICSKYPWKISKFNTEGEFQEEKRLSSIISNTDQYGYPKFFVTSDMNCYFFHIKYPSNVRQLPEGPFKFPLRFYRLSPDFREKEEIYSFETEGYKYKGGWTGYRPPSIAQKDSTTLLISVTGKYQILQLDLKTQKVTKTYSRKYERVKNSRGEYKSDTGSLFYVSPHLWVVTSTYDENDNPLIDVFDLDKGFRESFYLVFPNPDPEKHYRKIFHIDKNFTYTIEDNPEGFYSIIKYRMD